MRPSNRATSRRSTPALTSPSQTTKRNATPPAPNAASVIDSTADIGLKHFVMPFPPRRGALPRLAYSSGGTFHTSGR